MVVAKGRQKRSKIYYLYSSDKISEAKFLGTLRDGVFNPHPITEGDPSSNLVAMSRNGKNDYPDLFRIKRAEKHEYGDGKTGYSFHYE